MARRQGQVDERKSEAILDAAAALFADKGLQAKMEEIARLAGVSKQTVYNRFASKLEIAQALANKRVEDIIAPLRGAGDPQAVLESLALTLLNKVCSADKVGSMRGVALVSTEAPEIARAIYEAGPRRSLRELAAWLTEQTRLGRLEVADPEQAAEMFSGLVLGHGHLRAMLDVPQLAPEKRAARASEAARIFVAAHPPKTS
ncbi:TetR/AcrR family transcriptional regulator C-terminal domain-containing protein [Brevundimonas sp.]|jgi:TetR/AcrR family transcriptional repressor of mexJK operon|uniref:TetR/AcrR family transcriptional regulator C-terminal domain-containing protein n=1 Tax=Brevundimonas sp. TaxID=1871086 RepID=UPI0037C156F1